MTSRVCVAVATLLTVAVLVEGAQKPAPAAGTSVTPSFEVAAIRPNMSGLPEQSSRVGGGSVAMTNLRIRALIVRAYGIRPERILDAPSWVDQERFDITARAPAGTPDQQLALMLRTLLAERFQFVANTVVRDAPVYALVPARRNGTVGPDLKPSTQCDPKRIPSGLGRPELPTGTRPCTVVTGSNGREAYITGGARSIDAFVQALQGLTERPVVNRSDLSGTYDFDLRFGAASATTQLAAVSDVPDIFTALQEQLGLRLEATRGPVEFLVVERIERPTPN